MGIVDFILNLAGLLLWLNWRSDRFDPLLKRTPATLMGTLRPAAPKKIRRWHFLLFMAALLFLRAVIYWWIGAAVNWVGKIDFGVVVLPFACRSNWFGLEMMTLFSFFSFALARGIFYLWLLLLSLLAGPDPPQRLLKIPLGRLEGCPLPPKIVVASIRTVIL